MEPMGERHPEKTVVEALAAIVEEDMAEREIDGDVNYGGQTLEGANQVAEEEQICGKSVKNRGFEKKTLYRKRGSRKFRNRAVKFDSLFLSIARRKRGSSSKRCRRDSWGSIGNDTQCDRTDSLDAVESNRSTGNAIKDGCVLPRFRLKVKLGRDCNRNVIEAKVIRSSESDRSVDEGNLETDKFNINIVGNDVSVSEDMIGNKDSEGTVVSSVSVVRRYDDSPNVPAFEQLNEKGSPNDAGSPDSEVSNFVSDGQLNKKVNGVTGSRVKPLKKRGGKLKGSVDTSTSEIVASSPSANGSTNSLNSKEFSKDLINFPCEIDGSKEEGVAEVQAGISMHGDVNGFHFQDSEFHVSSNKSRGQKHVKSDESIKKKSYGRSSRSKSKKRNGTKKKGKESKITSKRKVKYNTQDQDYVVEHDPEYGKINRNEMRVASTETVDLSATSSGDHGPSIDNAWVRCDDCHKWRRISEQLADSIGQSNCHWTCRDNRNRSFADCSVPQEMSNSDINAELGISDEDAETFDSFSYSLASECSSTAEAKEHEFVRIASNQFLHRNRKNQNIDEIMVCGCKRPIDGGLGCKDGCLNRMLNIECIPGTCPCGDLCSNQQFQKHSYAKMKWVRCGKKGFGLRSEEDISEGQFLIEYVGEVLDMRTYQTRLKEYAAVGHKHFYFMTLDGSEVIDACAKGNLGRFINHSCDPNCRTEKWVVNGEICIGLFALRDIKKDEELTFDYNYVRVVGAAAKQCYCGSRHCRGYIGGDPVNADFIDQVDSDEEFPEPVMYEEEWKTEKKSRIRIINSEEKPVHLHNDYKIRISVPIVGDLDIASEYDGSSNKSDDVLGEQTEATCVGESKEVSVEAVTALDRPDSSSERELQQEGSTSKYSDSVQNSEATLDNMQQNLPLEMASSKWKSALTGEKRVFVKSRFYIKSSDQSLVVKKGKYPVLNMSSRKSQSSKSDFFTWKPKKLVEAVANGRFEAVEEKLNDLLDIDGGISKRKDAPRGYLQLLHLTAASGNGNGETIQSNRDLSLLLDAILKTRSRVVLNDIIQKNVLQKLHNMMKQCRRDFKRMPILRKVLKVLDFLALKEVLTLEQICKGPSHPGIESFIESMLSLTEHDDKQVHQIARNFRDKWIPRHVRKICFLDRDEERKKLSGVQNTCIGSSSEHHFHEQSLKSNSVDITKPVNAAVLHSLESCASGINRTRKRKTRWDQDNQVGALIGNNEPTDASEVLKQPEQKKACIIDGELLDQGKQHLDDAIEHSVDTACEVKESTIEDVPPGFSSPHSKHVTPIVLLASSDMPQSASDTVIGNSQSKFLSRLPVSYGFPMSIVQQFGLPMADEVDSWVIAPGMAFQPFPPLPLAPNPNRDVLASISTSTDSVVEAEHNNRKFGSVAEDYPTTSGLTFGGSDIAGANHQCGFKRSRDYEHDLGKKYFRQKKWKKPLPWIRNGARWGHLWSNTRTGMGLRNTKDNNNGENIGNFSDQEGEHRSDQRLGYTS